MRGSPLDLTGQKFHRLTAIRRAGYYRAHPTWLFLCDCGKEHEAIGSRVRAGYTKSCGCLSREVTRARSVRHGHFGSRTYASWTAMLSRCTNENHHAWDRYGGAGIGVCEEWRSFDNFLADMGERPPGTSIDRIDGTKGYEASNCRWATRSEQNKNRRPFDRKRAKRAV
jgi:hypothetical protein